MPSSDKTPYLGLNKWSGGDKPKKDDFNADNGAVDTAYGKLSGDVSNMEQRVGEMGDAVAQAGRAVESLAGHVDDGGIHVTAAEKALWNSLGGGSEVLDGAFTGNGQAQRQVTLQKKPRFGIVYAKGKGAVELNAAQSVCNAYFGFFGSAGCGRNLRLSDDGLTLVLDHTVTASGDNQYYCYNESGVEYVLAYWPQ